MSDFYTKKQKKFWCDYCKKFIEYTKQIIDQHNRSKNHKMMAERETKFQMRKSRNEKFKNSKTIENSSFPVYLNKKVERNYHIMSNKQTYNESNNYLEEIKQEKKLAEQYSKGFIEELSNQRTWGVFLDEASKLPFYYNFITKHSQWEKPNDYDGPDFEVNNKDVDEVQITKAEPGQWEYVEPNQSLFKRKATEEEEDYEESKYHYPGLNDDKFESEGDFEVSDEGEPQIKQEKLIDISPTIRKTKLDMIINEEEPLINKHDITKDALMTVNKQLKSKDYDFRYIDQAEFNEKTTLKRDQPRENITINFKKKEKPKLNIFRDD